jgi:hypothetical protein
VSSLGFEVRKLLQSAERFAARLNPGLSAIAIVLSIVLSAEFIRRAPDMDEAFVTAANAQLPSDAMDPTQATSPFAGWLPATMNNPAGY